MTSPPSTRPDDVVEPQILLASRVQAESAFEPAKPQGRSSASAATARVRRSPASCPRAGSTRWCTRPRCSSVGIARTGHGRVCAGVVSTRPIRSAPTAISTSTTSVGHDCIVRGLRALWRRANISGNVRGRGSRRCGNSGAFGAKVPPRRAMLGHRHGRRGRVQSIDVPSDTYVVGVPAEGPSRPTHEPPDLPLAPRHERRRARGAA